MELSDEKTIQDVRLFVLAGVSKEYGKRAIEELEAEGAIAPWRSPTGRTFLSQREAEAVIKTVTRAA
jgi:hypothetical protein